MLNFSVKRSIYGTLSSLTKLSRENNVGGLMINWVWVYIFHKFPTFIFADKSTIINMKCSCNVRIDNSERVLNSTEKPCPIQTWVCTNIYKIDRWSLLKVLQKCEKSWDQNQKVSVGYLSALNFLKKLQYFDKFHKHLLLSWKFNILFMTLTLLRRDDFVQKWKCI